VAASSSKEEKIRVEKHFYLAEAFHHELYTALAKDEGNQKLKALLTKLSKTEEYHMNLWKSTLGVEGIENPRQPILPSIQLPLYRLARRIFGVAFITRVMERNETEVFTQYGGALEKVRFNLKERKIVDAILKDEEVHEQVLKDRVKALSGDIDYIRSVVFGLNDGLVELLAAVVGLAVIATSPLIVAAGGIIVGVSGTLSMAGGAYLSSKSHILVEHGEDTRAHESEHMDTSPVKDALYTGIYYFIGALIAISPFVFGLSGTAGIVTSIVLVSIALAIASIIIAIISYTSIKQRIFEMLAISLGAAFITIVLGFILRYSFGISV
jgi:vacuolar iron transporter family protein